MFFSIVFKSVVQCGKNGTNFYLDLVSLFSQRRDHRSSIKFYTFFSNFPPSAVDLI